MFKNALFSISSFGGKNTKMALLIIPSTFDGGQEQQQEKEREKKEGKKKKRFCEMYLSLAVRSHL